METSGIDMDAVSERIGAKWWLFVTFGVLVALLGMVIIARPVAGVFGIVVFVSAGFIVSGLSDVALADRWGPARWLAIVWGALSVAVGVAALVWPNITVVALAVLIGIGLVLRGLVQAVGAVVVRPPSWLAWLIFGLVEIAVGIAAIAWPGVTLAVLAILIGINLVLVGVIQVGVGLAVRSAAR